MGNDIYHRDVVNTSSSVNIPSAPSIGTGGNKASKKAVSAFKQLRLHPSMDPFNRVVKTNAENLIFLGLDVTGSNIQFIYNIWDKMPMFQEQIEKQGTLPHAEINFSAIGDARCDSAPLQVAEFASGDPLDEWLTKIFPEGRGGGQRMETYELWAYYLSHKVQMNPQKVFAFLQVDEAPYPTLAKSDVRRIIGDSLPSDIGSHMIFAELNRKLNGNLYILQNPYYGTDSGRTDETLAIYREWQSILGEDGGTIIPLNEEKSMVDVILGVLALKTNARSLSQYQKDMKARKQSDERIANVTNSLNSASKTISPIQSVGSSLPEVTNNTDRNSGARRL